MENTSYDPQFFATIAAIEDRHFWFTARNRTIHAAVKPVVTSLPDGYRVLEVGCGTGFVLKELVQLCQRGEVVGMDLYPEAVEFARARASCQVLVGDVLKPLDLELFDVVCAFDVIEHLDDDVSILQGLRKLLKPGGTLFVTVPAHPYLWSYFDESACHKRRYECATLRAALNAAGFSPDYMTEFMMSIFPLVWLNRKLASRKQASDADLAKAELRIVPVVNEALRAALSLESLVIRSRGRLPIGTSILASASNIAS
jgi:SAM-dependent methyltransferase